MIKKKVSGVTFSFIFIFVGGKKEKSVRFGIECFIFIIMEL